MLAAPMYLTATFRTVAHSKNMAFCAPIMTAPRAVPTPAATTPKTAPMVFVAGASGNVGRRLVKTLAEAGCAVRAGCRDVASCKEKVGSLGDVEELVSYVPFDVTESPRLEAAIGDAEVVVSTLGAPFSFGKVDGFGIANLMGTAAVLPAVKQLIVVSSIGVGRPFAFPAALLNLFGGVLLFKDYSEAATRRVALNHSKTYFIVRPGGMERPTDDFKLTHNLKLEPRNSLSGGLVSQLQIAELVTAAILNPDAAANKTVEAIAEETAPKVDLDTLLSTAKKDK